MGYEEQLRQAERILDKMNAAKGADSDLKKRLAEVEAWLAAIGAVSMLSGALLFLHLLAHSAR